MVVRHSKIDKERSGWRILLDQLTQLLMALNPGILRNYSAFDVGNMAMVLENAKALFQWFGESKVTFVPFIQKKDIIVNNQYLLIII